MRAGHPYDQFWRITLREFDLIMGASAERVQDRIKLERALGYGLASLISIGVSNPKKFPKADAYLGTKRRDPQPEDLERYLAALARQAPPPKHPSKDV